MKDNRPAWVFDIDGVLTDPQKKHIIEPALLAILVQLLTGGDVVGFNTGRSTQWIREKLLTILFEKIHEKTHFQNFAAIGEKGGTWFTVDATGEIFSGKDADLSVPQMLSAEIKQRVEKYSDAMFFDATKQTMISVEMHDGFDLTTFHDKQKEFIKEILPLVTHDLKLDKGIIATDVEKKEAGKAKGINRLLAIWEEKNLSPKQFLTFGDSKGDLAMADELDKRGKKVRFIFVGDKKVLEGIKRNYPITVIPGYSRGTLLFLEKELKKGAGGSSYS